MTNVNLKCVTCGATARRQLLEQVACRGVHNTACEPAFCPRGHGLMVREDGGRVRNWGTDVPLAVKGFTSYRYKGLFDWVMIGAKDHADALVQAERSLCGKRAVLEELQIWSVTEYVPVIQ